MIFGTSSTQFSSVLLSILSFVYVICFLSNLEFRFNSCREVMSYNSFEFIISCLKIQINKIILLKS